MFVTLFLLLMLIHIIMAAIDNCKIRQKVNILIKKTEHLSEIDDRSKYPKYEYTGYECADCANDKDANLTSHKQVSRNDKIKKPWVIVEADLVDSPHVVQMSFELPYHDWCIFEKTTLYRNLKEYLLEYEKLEIPISQPVQKD